MDGNINNFKEFIDIINRLNTESEIADFVSKRLDILESKSPKETISNNNDGKLIGTITEGYINSDSPILTSFLVEPFYLNDMTLYIEFIKYIKGKDFPSFLNIFYELRDFTRNEFGLIGNQSIREIVYLQKRENKISIADFYKNDSALCSERSAAVQNIAEFCGIDSYLIFGKLEVNGTTSSHAYNIFKATDGILILFDSTNYVELDCNGKVGYAPAFSIIGKEDINSVKEINFDFEYLSKIHNLPIYESEKARKYKTCNYELNNQNVSETNVRDLIK